jgi:hypothetical protein
VLGLVTVIFNRQWSKYAGEWSISPRPSGVFDERYEYRRPGAIFVGIVLTVVGLEQVLHYGFHIL